MDREPFAAMNQPADALTYLITWTCYGTWLHGDARGSVDREQNVPGTPHIDEDHARHRANENRRKHPPYQLGSTSRPIVLQAIRDVCAFRGWELWAAHVRTNHVHVVVTADAAPERVMSDLKAHASRALNRAGVDGRRACRWTRHGSTKYLNRPEAIDAAIEYVLEWQGARIQACDVTDAGALWTSRDG
jgi:hypothetical protein